MNLVEARDEMFAMLNAAWDSSYPIQWESRAGAEGELFTPAQAVVWGRATLRHSSSASVSLSGAVGKQRFEREGFLVVQVFLEVGSEMDLAYNLGQSILDAFEGQKSPGGIWFRDSQFTEIGPDNAWFQFQFRTTFRFDEVK